MTYEDVVFRKQDRERERGQLQNTRDGVRDAVSHYLAVGCPCTSKDDVRSRLPADDGTTESGHATTCEPNDAARFSFARLERSARALLSGPSVVYIVFSETCKNTLLTMWPIQRKFLEDRSSRTSHLLARVAVVADDEGPRSSSRQQTGRLARIHA